MRKESSGAIQFKYPIISRASVLGGMILITLGFLSFPRFVNKIVLEEEVQIVIEQIDIPQTEQFDRPPPPARPSVPVESESEDIADFTTGSAFKPYVTTVGLHDDDGNLLVVGKLGQPIKASSENSNEIETIEARNKPTWLPPDPILSLGVRARLIYERLRAKSEI